VQRWLGSVKHSEALAMIPHHLESGWAALSEGDWRRARACFEEAVAVEETPEALEGLGWAGYCLDDERLSFDARERAYRLYRERGDDSSAARVASWLAGACLEFRGEPAVANGWLQRAHSLLEDLEPGPDHGWLAIHEADIALAISEARLEALEARLAEDADEQAEELQRGVCGTCVARLRPAGHVYLSSKAAWMLGRERRDSNPRPPVCQTAPAETTPDDGRPAIPLPATGCGLSGEKTSARCGGRFRDVWGLNGAWGRPSRSAKSRRFANRTRRREGRGRSSRSATGAVAT
jgi:hypothetical protein